VFYNLIKIKLTIEYTCQIAINKPVGEVIQKLDCAENIKH